MVILRNATAMDYSLDERLDWLLTSALAAVQAFRGASIRRVRACLFHRANDKRGVLKTVGGGPRHGLEPIHPVSTQPSCAALSVPHDPLGQER